MKKFDRMILEDQLKYYHLEFVRLTTKIDPQVFDVNIELAKKRDDVSKRVFELFYSLNLDADIKNPNELSSMSAAELNCMLEKARKDNEKADADKE